MGKVTSNRIDKMPMTQEAFAQVRSRARKVLLNEDSTSFEKHIARSALTQLAEIQHNLKASDTSD